MRRIRKKQDGLIIFEGDFSLEEKVHEACNTAFCTQQDHHFFHEGQQFIAKAGEPKPVIVMEPIHQPYYQ